MILYVLYEISGCIYTLIVSHGAGAEFGKRVLREEGEGALSPRLQQMLGVVLMNGGGNIYDPEWLAANPRPDLM